MFELLDSVILAQDGVEAARSATEVQSVWDFVVKGGWMMIPLGLCSLVALAVFAERLITLRRSAVMPPDFVPGLEKRLKDGGRDAALKYCQNNNSPVASVFEAGVRKLGQPVEIVEKHIVEAGQREVLKLRKNLRVLSVIAAVVPLLGLLGTIFGMIEAFETVATSAEALGKTEMLAGGIYAAMITTAAGLIVAIPALIGYHILVSRVDRLVMDIDHATVEFMEEHIADQSHMGASSGSTTATTIHQATTPGDDDVSATDVAVAT